MGCIKGCNVTLGYAQNEFKNAVLGNVRNEFKSAVLG
jgi:hypothetical protein